MFAPGKNVMVGIFPSALPTPVVGNGFQARFTNNSCEAASCSKSEAQREAATESLSQSKVKRWHGRFPFQRYQCRSDQHALQIRERFLSSEFHSTRFNVDHRSAFKVPVSCHRVPYHFHIQSWCHKISEAGKLCSEFIKTRPSSQFRQLQAY